MISFIFYSLLVIALLLILSFLDWLTDEDHRWLHRRRQDRKDLKHG